MWPVIAALGVGSLIFFPRQTKAGLTMIGGTAKEVFGPFLTFGPPMQSSIDSAAMAIARQNLIAREGRRKDVYIDSRGFATVGIGHKVLPSDNLRVGDIISDAQIEALFQKDIAEAFAAAKSQAKELRKYNPDMIAALTSVNFQLGTFWRSKFTNTWADLKNDNVQGAIYRLQSSDWRSQTPVRVADFIAALERNFA